MNQVQQQKAVRLDQAFIRRVAAVYAIRKEQEVTDMTDRTTNNEHAFLAVCGTLRDLRRVHAGYQGWRWQDYSPAVMNFIASWEDMQPTSIWVFNQSLHCNISCAWSHRERVRDNVGEMGVGEIAEALVPASFKFVCDECHGIRGASEPAYTPEEREKMWAAELAGHPERGDESFVETSPGRPGWISPVVESGNAYRVVWEIDVEGSSPRDAAISARGAMIDRDSTATIFTVKRWGSEDDPIDVDLADPDIKEGCCASDGCCKNKVSQ